jgi:hypothetical protein
MKMFKFLAPKLRDNNWTGLIPLHNPGKRPLIRGWQEYNKRPPHDYEIDNWCSISPDAGIGLACGNDPVVGVDQDILDPQVAQIAANIAEVTLGFTPLQRIGRYPKKLFIYGNDGSVVSNGNYGQHELFVTSRQFVLYNIHPDTLQPYRYQEAQPEELSPSDLPQISQMQIDEYLGSMSKLLGPRSVTFSQHSYGTGNSNCDGHSWIKKWSPLRCDDEILQVAFDALRTAAPGTRHDTLISITVALARLGFYPRDHQGEITVAFASSHSDGEQMEAQRQVDNAIKWVESRGIATQLDKVTALGNITGSW